MGMTIRYPLMIWHVFGTDTDVLKVTLHGTVGMSLCPLGRGQVPIVINVQAFLIHLITVDLIFRSDPVQNYRMLTLYVHGPIFSIRKALTWEYGKGDAHPLHAASGLQTLRSSSLNFQETVGSIDLK